MNAALVPALLARRYFAASVAPIVCARLMYAHAVLFRLTVYQIQTDDLAATPGQVPLRYLLPLSERKHAVQALVVLGLAYAAAFPIQSAIVYRLRVNGVFLVSAVVRFPMLAQLGR